MQFIKKVLSIILVLAFAVWLITPHVYAWVNYAPSATIGPGGITTTRILDNTILGDDIYRGASTTVDHINATYYNATSTTATSTFAGGLEVGWLGVNSSTTLFAKNINGADRVGIGTNNPGVFLSQDYSDTVNALHFKAGSPRIIIESTVSSAIDFVDTSGTTNYRWIQERFIDGVYKWIRQPDAGSGTEELLTLNIETGKFGFGTTSPYAKLSVAGTIVADNINATSTNATSTFSGGVKLNKAGSGIEFQDGTIQTTSAHPTVISYENFNSGGSSGSANCTATSTIPGNQWFVMDAEYSAYFNPNRSFETQFFLTADQQATSSYQAYFSTNGVSISARLTDDTLMVCGSGSSVGGTDTVYLRGHWY